VVLADLGDGPDNAVDVAGEQFLEDRGDVVGVEARLLFKEERVAQGFGGAGDPVEGAAGADEFGPGGDHAQGIGALADEAAGQGAGLVAELVDDVLDAFSGFWGETSGRSLMTRETVWVETPAAEATSLMVGRRERWGGQIYATI